jgi:acyl-CoA synthetase (AMP-forming)/AMP-acid ligase II
MDIAAKTSFADIFQGLAMSYGDRPALISGDRMLTFAGLAAEGARWARALQSEGVRPGDQVGLALRDGLETVVAMLALWMLDAVAVPIDFRNRTDERARLAAEFDLTAILEDRDLSGGAYRSLVCGGGWATQVARQPSNPPDRHPTLGHPAFISLTSGTTGRPLGIVIGHRTLLLRSMGYGFEGAYPFGGRFLNAYPLSFSASRNHTIGQLLRGATVQFHPPLFGPAELVEKVNAQGVTFLFAVPATVNAMLALAPEGQGPLMPGLKVLYCGGSGMLAADKARAWRDLTPGFLHCFSSSVSGTCSVLAGADLATHAHTDGRIMPTVRLQVVDAEDRPLPHGEVGLMRMRSHGMAEGLYKNRAREAGDRIRDGWAYTGDLATISADGFLTVVGRGSDMIIRGGANVYPAEVEAILAALSGVREVAVVGFASAAVDEEIAAFVVAGPDVTVAALEAHCRVQLQPDKRPRKFVLVDSLPRNTNGKVLVRELRARLEGQG